MKYRYRYIYLYIGEAVSLHACIKIVFAAYGRICVQVLPRHPHPNSIMYII